MPTQYSGNGRIFPLRVRIPSDGERLQEKIIAPAWKDCADRATYLKRVMPSIYSFALPVGATVGPSALWTYGNSAGWEFSTAASPTPLKVDVAYPSDGSGVCPAIKVQASLSYSRKNSMSKPFTLTLAAQDTVDATPGVVTAVPGASWDVPAPGLLTADSTYSYNVQLSGVWTPAAFGTTRFCLAFFSATMSNGASDEFKVWSLSLTAQVFPARLDP